MPFWYLKNDGFWHIHFIDDPREKVYTPSRKWLNDNVEFVSLDNELWLLLEIEKWRTKLRNFILKYKLSEVFITAGPRTIAKNKTSVSFKNNINQKEFYDLKRDKPWTENEEKSLIYFFNSGRDNATLAKLFGRSESAVKLRLSKLGLI